MQRLVREGSGLKGVLVSHRPFAFLQHHQRTQTFFVSDLLARRNLEARFRKHVLAVRTRTEPFSGSLLYVT